MSEEWPPNAVAWVKYILRELSFPDAIKCIESFEADNAALKAALEESNGALGLKSLSVRLNQIVANRALLSRLQPSPPAAGTKAGVGAEEE